MSNVHKYTKQVNCGDPAVFSDVFTLLTDGSPWPRPRGITFLLTLTDGQPNKPLVYTLTDGQPMEVGDIETYVLELTTSMADYWQWYEFFAFEIERIV